MRETVYRDEVIEICERWRQRAKKLHDRDGWYMADILLRFMKEIPSADRPSGEVDAVKEYERQVHNLNQGYITLGEFDKRIEPLRHLYYDRPSGEWIDAGTDLDGTHYYRCSNCGWEVDTDYPNCPYCTAKMKGAEDE